MKRYRCTIELEAGDSLAAFSHDILDRSFKLLRATKMPVTFSFVEMPEKDSLVVKPDARGMVRGKGTAPKSARLKDVREDLLVVTPDIAGP